MYDVFSGWRRPMASEFSVAQTGLRAYETLGAANAAIAAGTGIIGSAMRSPLSGGHAELSRMVPGEDRRLFPRRIRGGRGLVVGTAQAQDGDRN